MTPISRAAIADALQEVGLKRGDTVFIHSDLKRLGLARKGDERICLALEAEDLHAVLLEVLGKEGTIVVPTFSFTRDDVFIIERTSGTNGIFSEYIRTRPGALRSHHPLISVSALGPKAVDLISGSGKSGFGTDSPYEGLHRINARLLMIGVPFCSFKDYVETVCQVPYRYEKKFTSVIEKADHRSTITYTHFVRYRTREKEVALNPFLSGLNPEERAGIRSKNLGSGTIHCIEAEEAYDLLTKILTGDPYRFVTETFCDFHVFEFLKKANGYVSSTGWRLESSVEQFGKEEIWQWILLNPNPEIKSKYHLGDVDSMVISVCGAEQCMEAAAQEQHITDETMLSFLYTLFKASSC